MATLDMNDPHARRFMFLLQMRGRMKLELTGVRFKGPATLKTLNAQENRSFKTRKEALPWVEEQINRMLQERENEERAKRDN